MSSPHHPNPIQEEIDASNGVPLLQPVAAAAVAENQQLTEQPHHQEQYVAPQKTALQRQNEGFVAFNKGFDDCEVTPEAINPIKKDTGKVKPPQLTPLKSIAGVPVDRLKIDDLRMFCSHNGVKGSRKAKKLEVCWAICKAKEAYQAGQRGPFKDLIPEPAKKEHVWNETAAAAAGGDAAATIRKRRVEYVSDGTTLLPPAKRGVNVEEHMALQQRLVQSKEEANRAIQVHELVESSALLRSQIRDEKERRAAMWKELLSHVGGDESQAAALVKECIERKASGVNDLVVKGAYDILIESVMEQDETLREMKNHSAAMSKDLARLLAPQEQQGKSAVAEEEVQDDAMLNV